MEILKNKTNKFILGIIILFFILLVVYFGISMFFINHFYFGSTVSCINVAGKTVEEVNKEIPTQIEQYSLELKERGNTEQIKGADIGLKYNSNEKIQQLKDKQNPFKWITAFFNSKNSAITEVVTYDEKLFNQTVNNLSCFNDKSIVAPQNPTFEYKNGEYIIDSEINGNKVNKDILIDNIKRAILNGETSLDLEKDGCYEKPQYSSDSKEIIDTKDTLNKYIAAKITYTYGDKTEVLDGSKINTWLSVNDKLEIIFDEEKIKKYLDDLADKCNTVGKTREFATTMGTTIKVNGGDYGWMINKEGEVKDLIADVKQGEAITKEPIYMQAAISHGKNDIGDTYVEINMSKQHLWYYKNGSLVVDGDVVTGNVSNRCATPTGVYKLKYKQRDATLKGEGYSTKVNFWMPFNGGIGIHDASWRSVFGGNIYMTSGSHGCVNAPYNLANTIFNNIDEGIPVVCYY